MVRKLHLETRRAAGFLDRCLRGLCRRTSLDQPYLYVYPKLECVALTPNPCSNSLRLGNHPKKFVLNHPIQCSKG